MVRRPALGVLSPAALAGREKSLSVRDHLADIFPAVDGSAPVEWIIAEGLTGYEDAVAFMEDRAAAIAEGESPRAGLARRASAALYRWDLGAGCGPRRARSLSGSPQRAGRAVYLSRTRTAGRLRDARPEPPPAGSAPLRVRARGLADCCARPVQCSRRAAGRPGRGLGAAAGAGRGRRGQDRRHRHSGAALGEFPRDQHQRRTRPQSISPESSPAVSASTGSRAWSILGFRLPCPKSMRFCARRSKRSSARPSALEEGRSYPEVTSADFPPELAASRSKPSRQLHFML